MKPVFRNCAFQLKKSLYLFLSLIGLLCVILAGEIVSQAEASSINLNYTPVDVDARKCLPPKKAFRPAPPSFLSKVYEEMKSTCSNANLSEEDRLEYLTITLGVSVPNPATPYLAAHGATKFTGFMKDCIVQAFLNSSVGSFRAEDRQVLKDAFGGIETAKGWAEYVKGVPEMSTEDKVEDLISTLETIKKKTKEGLSNKTVSEYLSGGYDTAERALRLVSMGQMKTLVNDYDFALEACRFKEAEKFIREAEGFALKNCREYGWQLRRREKAFLSHVQRYRTRYERSKTVSQDSELSKLYDRIKRSKHTLSIYIGDQIYGSGKKSEKSFLAMIEAKKQEVKDRWHGFGEQQSRHGVQQKKVLEALRNGNAGCQTIASLEKRLHHYSDQCKRQFFKGDGVRLWSSEELYDRLEQNGRKQISQWWDQANEIRGLFHNCKSREAEVIKSTLQADMAANPVFSYIAGQCGPKKLTDLQGHLADLIEPEHCHKRKVPKVVGAPLDRATDAIYEAGLVPGEVYTLQNDQGKWNAGSVVKTDPKGGTVVAPQSTVDIFQAGKVPQKPDDVKEMVNVPKVVGEYSKDAISLLKAAGLFASINDKQPADDLKEEPDQVYSSTPKPGDVVAIGSTIVLNIYGSRPFVEVPTIAGLSFKEAASLLAANKLQITDRPALGIIAPTDKMPGEIYASTPPAKSFQKIFTNVRPLVYAQELRLVPKLQHMSISQARKAITGEDNFFKAGKTALGITAPSDKQVGEVYGSIPEAFTPHPRGTVVSPVIYGPPTRTQPAPITQPTPVKPVKPADNSSGTECPDPNKEPGKHAQRIYKNGDKNSKVYVDCRYFKDGRLKVQTGWKNRSREGTWLSYLDYPECGGRILTNKKTYANGNLLNQVIRYCNTDTGVVHTK